MKVRSSWVRKSRHMVWYGLHVIIVSRKNSTQARIGVKNRQGNAAVREMSSVPQLRAPPDLGTCKLRDKTNKIKLAAE